MTITTPRSRSCSTSVVTIVALLAAFGMFAAANARAADRPLNAIDVWETVLQLPIADEGDMHFGPARVDLRDRNRVTISADVTVTGGDGRQTTSSIIAILIGFMDYTDDVGLVDGVDASARGISDGTSNTIFFGARACAAIGRAWNAYLRAAIIGGPNGFAIDVGTSEALTLENTMVSGYWIGAEPGSATCVVR